MSYNVDTIPQFDKQAKRLIKKFPSLKKDLNELILSLSENPVQGKSLDNNFAPLYIVENQHCLTNKHNIGVF